MKECYFSLWDISETQFAKESILIEVFSESQGHDLSYLNNNISLLDNFILSRDCGKIYVRISLFARKSSYIEIYQFPSRTLFQEVTLDRNHDSRSEMHTTDKTRSVERDQKKKVCDRSPIVALSKQWHLL